MSDKKQQILDLQNELRQTVASHRLALLNALNELREFGGKDQYDTSVSFIVYNSGKDGVLVTHLRDVLPDSADLNKAIEALKGTEIEETGKGRSITLVSKKKPDATPNQGTTIPTQLKVPPSNSQAATIPTEASTGSAIQG